MPVTSLTHDDLLRGDLSQVQLVDLIGAIHVDQLSGRLDLRRGLIKKELYFASGLPIYVTSLDEKEGLLECLAQVNQLAPEDLLQIKKLMAERGLSAEDVIKLLDLLTDAELYALKTETFMRRAIDACGWREGGYEFHPGEAQVANVPLFDLNPLEIIYQGVKTHLSLDLAAELHQIEKRRARLRHGWEQTLALPKAYFEHSDVLDRFEQETTIGDGIPRLYQEFGDLNEALLFLYLLISTGLLILKDVAAEPGENSGEIIELDQPDLDPPPLPAAPPLSATFYVSTTRRREQVQIKPAKKKKEPAPTPPAPTLAPTPAAPPARDAVELQLEPLAAEDHALEVVEVETAAGESFSLQGSLLLLETGARLETIAAELEAAMDYFDRLGVTVETDPTQLGEALDRKLAEFALDHLPEAVSNQLADQHDRVVGLLDQAYFALTDPDLRMDHEQQIFNKRELRAADLDQKQKLAIMQWRRGLWYMNHVSRHDLARKCFHQALDLDPKQPHYYAYVGWASYRGDLKGEHLSEVLDYLNHALAISPSYDQAHYFLGVIAKRRGDRDQAQRHFHDALQSNPEHLQARRELNLYQSHDKQESLFSKLFGKKSR